MDRVPFHLAMKSMKAQKSRRHRAELGERSALTVLLPLGARAGLDRGQGPQVNGSADRLGRSGSGVSNQRAEAKHGKGRGSSRGGTRGPEC